MVANNGAHFSEGHLRLASSAAMVLRIGLLAAVGIGIGGATLISGNMTVSQLDTLYKLRQANAALVIGIIGVCTVSFLLLGLTHIMTLRQLWPMLWASTFIVSPLSLPPRTPSAAIADSPRLHSSSSRATSSTPPSTRPTRSRLGPRPASTSSSPCPSSSPSSPSSPATSSRPTRTRRPRSATCPPPPPRPCPGSPSRPPRRQRTPTPNRKRPPSDPPPPSLSLFALLQSRV